MTNSLSVGRLVWQTRLMQLYEWAVHASRQYSVYSQTDLRWIADIETETVRLERIVYRVSVADDVVRLAEHTLVENDRLRVATRITVHNTLPITRQPQSEFYQFSLRYRPNTTLGWLKTIQLVQFYNKKRTDGFCYFVEYYQEIYLRYPSCNNTFNIFF